jgi:RNA 2',3'-cyclic 3'-phosphodiesterase
VKRTFFAFELPEGFMRYYAQEVYPLITGLEGVRAVAPENCHITLKFLGDTEEEKLEEIAKRVAARVQERQPVETSFTGIGCFPDMKRPRVIWLGFDDGGRKIREISKIVDDAVHVFGIEMEKRPFQAHVTAGRVKTAVRQEDLKQVSDMVSRKMYIEKIKLDVITFFESRLTPKGSVYSVIAKIPLKGLTDNI